MADKNITLSFKKEKETTNTHMFVEQNDPDKQVVGRVYMQKTELEKLGNPENIKVVISAAA